MTERIGRHDDGPDFLCIGMQKAGTRWLYDLLQFEPGFWMPPIKEFHFFDRPHDFARRVEKLHHRIAKPGLFSGWKRARKNKRPFDGRDAAFSAHADTYDERGASIDWYKALFAPKGELLSGEVTPGYSALADSAIEAVARGLPDVRLILLLRDPVSRLWSQFNMYSRRRSADPGGEPGSPAERVARFLERDGVRERSFPTRIYGRWASHFDAARIKCLFFDDVASTPGEVRKDLLSFFGLPEAAPAANRVALGFNRKASALKQPMDAEARAFLVETFREELLRGAETFGGGAEGWPARYGVR